MTDAAALLYEARLRAGLSQAELARRAGIPRSVLNAYERGRREPGANALDRVLRAAGFHLALAATGAGTDERAGRILAQVLELAEVLPVRWRGALSFPSIGPVPVLAQRIVAVHEALDGAGISHAFGGAIALAYCANEARTTLDLSLHVFRPPSDAEHLLAALPGDMVVDPRDCPNRIRAWWGDTPFDILLEAHAFDREVAARVRSAPFANTSLPIIDVSCLVVFKALCNRAEVWHDIEDMAQARTFDHEFALSWVRELLGRDHPAYERLAGLDP